MYKRILGLLGVAAMLASVSAHAQLKSVDHGAEAIDGSGLMWANTVGTYLSWSSTGAPGSAQAWVAGLNASDYGGYNDWTLATGDGSFGANTTTNQLGELFYTDCGNTPGALQTVLNIPGKNCKALSSVVTSISVPGAKYFSSSLYGAVCCDIYTTYWWMYGTRGSYQGAWNYDTTAFDGQISGSALAVRSVPEIDPTSAGSGLALLFGSLAVLRGRRTARSDNAIG
jgi:hypothetical protein